jgi:integrase
MPTDAPIIDAHAADLIRRNLRPSTIYQRRRVLARLKRDHPSVGLLDMTTGHITDALDGRRITPGTRACEIAHLAKFYDWAHIHHGIESPMHMVIRPRLPMRLPRPMPDDDVVRAVSTAPERIYEILMLAAHAGLRACEIAEVRYEHAILTTNPPLLMIPVSKGGSPSTVALHDELAEMFRHHRSGPMVTRRDGQPGANAAWTICQMANGYLHSLGIDHTLHTLRHWFGTKVLEASDGNLRTTQEAMRHRDIKSTVGYTWVCPGAVGEAVTAVPAITTRHRAIRVA